MIRDKRASRFSDSAGNATATNEFRMQDFSVRLRATHAAGKGEHKFGDRTIILAIGHNYYAPAVGSGSTHIIHVVFERREQAIV